MVKPVSVSRSWGCSCPQSQSLTPALRKSRTQGVPSRWAQWQHWGKHLMRSARQGREVRHAGRWAAASGGHRVHTSTQGPLHQERLGKVAQADIAPILALLVSYYIGSRRRITRVNLGDSQGGAHPRYLDDSLQDGRVPAAKAPER